MTAPLPTSTTAEPWSRLHPLTPVLRTGRVLAVAVALLTDRAVRGTGGAGATLAVLVLALAVGIAYGGVSWRTTRYRVEDGDLRLESGLVFRRSRRVPLARLQAVDVVRPLVARVLGLSELRLEVVGQGRGAEAPLAYLSDTDAQALRARLLALAGRAEAPSAGGALDERPAPERVLVRVPTSALVQSALLSGPAQLFALLVVVSLALLVVEPRAAAGVVVGLLPLAAATGGVVVRRLLGEYGATLAESPDGLRLRSGLLDTRAQTIPVGRVQALRVVQPLLWRAKRWVRVDLDVAGYGPGTDAGGSSGTLLPVAPEPLALATVARVLPALDAAGVPVVGVPRRARALDPVAWRVLAVGLDERVTVTRSGLLTRRTAVVPHAKVQSVRLVQGPLQRRLGLASVHLDTAGGRVAAVAAHRDTADAVRLLEEVTVLARRARTADRPGQQ